MASGAATAPGATLTAWGFLGRFMKVSSRALLTYTHSSFEHLKHKQDTDAEPWVGPHWQGVGRGGTERMLKKDMGEGVIAGQEEGTLLQAGWGRGQGQPLAAWRERW